MKNAGRLLLALVILLALPHVAWAQRVLVVRPPARDTVLFEAFGRLRAELLLQDFEVEVLRARETAAIAEELESEAQRRDAFAAIALQRTGRGTTAEIWIVDRVTGKTTRRELRIDPSAHGPTLLAVRAADLLRASLLELAPGERPTRDVLGVEPTPPPPEVVRFSRDVRRFQVRTGGVALVSPALGTAVGVLLGASFRPLERLAFELEIGGPMFGAEFDAETGIATVRQEFALLRSSWNLSRATTGPRWEWRPFVGAGAYHLQATGVVDPPFVAQTDEFWSFVAAAGAGVRYFFDDAVSFGLDANALALLPRPIIAVDDRKSSPVGLQGQAALSLGVAF